MKFLANSSQILTRAWSMWGLYVLFGLSVAQAAVEYLSDGSPLWGSIAAVVTALTMLVRLLPQPNMPGGAQVQRDGGSGEER